MPFTSFKNRKIGKRFRYIFSKKRFGAFLLLVCTILIAIVFFHIRKEIPGNTIDTIQLDYHQEKVAEGAYILHDREPIRQTLTQSKRVDVNLKVNKNASTDAKAGKEAYNWTVTLASGTVFAFGKQTNSGILPIVKVTAKDGTFVRYYPKTDQLRAIKPQVKKNVVSWEIAPGITARYTMQQDRVKADYIVKEKKSLAATKKLDFIVEHSEDISPEMMPDGELSWMKITTTEDPSGSAQGTVTEVFQFPVPLINETDNDEWEGSYQIRKIDKQTLELSLSLPEEKLAEAAFPITVDPQVVDALPYDGLNKFANGRTLVRDAWGNLITIGLDTNMFGFTEVFYKNYDATSWDNAGISLSGVNQNGQVSLDIDSMGNVHVTNKWTFSGAHNLDYNKLSVTRDGGNRISSISSSGLLGLDTSNLTARPSLIVANKGMGAGKEKVVIAYAVNTTNRGEIRVLQCDVADNCTTAANWKNVSEEKNGSGTCSDTNTAGNKGLPNSATCKGAADAILTTATTTTHHVTLAQMPYKSRRSPASAWFWKSSNFLSLANAIDNNPATTGDVSSLAKATDDAIYIGDTKPFSKVSIDIASTNSVTTNDEIEYWNGTTWTSPANQHFTSQSMAEDGSYTFDEPGDWTPTTVNGQTMYWARISLVCAGCSNFDSSVSIAEIYLNDRNSGALIVIGGDDGTDDLRTAYVNWDDVGQSSWENYPWSVAVPWLQSGTGASSGISNTGANWGTFTNFPLSVTIDYQTNGIYLAYMEGTTVGSSNITVKRAQYNRSLSVQSNWVSTGFPATTEAADAVFSLTSDQNSIYLFYVLDVGSTSLVYRRCSPAGGGNGNICDVAADWGSETTFVSSNATVSHYPAHPQPVVSKAFGDTLAIDVVYTDIGSLSVKYERHYVDMADRSLTISSSGDDAFHRDCDTGTDDQIIAAGERDLGREDTDSNCVSSVDSENHVGFRFTNVTVPQGAKISSAYLDVRVKARVGSTPIDFTVFGEDVDNSSAFSALTNCTAPCSGAVGTRTRTTNASTYSINFATVTYRIDVTDVVQEIVCRGASNVQPCVGNMNSSGSWSSGNALSILLISHESGNTDNRALLAGYGNTIPAEPLAKLQINLGSTDKNYSMGSATQIASGSASYADLDHPLSSSQISALSADDDIYASVAASMSYASGSAQPAFMFKTQNTNNNNTYQITGSVKVKSTSAPSSYPLYLQVYRGGDIQENVIDTSTSNTATSVGGRKLFYDTSNNLWWVFYNNGSAIEYSSSPDGKTWISRGTIATATSDFSVWYAEDIGIVYIAYPASGVGIRVQKGAIGSTSISWSSAVTAATDDDFAQPNISRDSNGRLWIAYYAQPGACTGSSTVACPQNYFAKRSINVDDITSWGSTQTLMLTGGLDGLSRIQVIPMTTSGDMLFVYNYGELSNSTFSRLWDDSAGSLTSEQYITSSHGSSISVVAGPSDTAHLVVGRGFLSSNIIKYFYYSSGTWSSSLTIGDVTQNDIEEVSMSIDPATNNVYALWTAGNKLYVRQGRSPYTSNDWADIVTISNTIRNITTVGYNMNLPYATSNQYLGILVTDGQSSPYSIEFNGYSLDRITKNKWETVAMNNTAAADEEVTLSAVVNTNISDYYHSEIPGLGCTSSSTNCWTYWRVYQDLDTSTNGQILSADMFSTLYEPTLPSQIVFTNSPRTLIGSVCGGAGQSFTIQLQNAYGAVANAATSTIVRITSNSSGETIYSDASCSTPVSNGDFTFAIGENTKTFYVMDTDASSATWTMSATRQSGHTLPTAVQDYSMSGPTKIVFTNPPRNVYKNTCSASFTIELQDTNNTAVNPGMTTVVRVSSDSVGETIYSDASCSTPVSNGDFTFTTGENSKIFYITDSVVTQATLSAIRQSGAILTTGNQDYNAVESPSNKVRGGVNFRGGVSFQ